MALLRKPTNNHYVYLGPAAKAVTRVGNLVNANLTSRKTCAKRYRRTGKVVMAEASSFRGYWAIRDVVNRMDPLVDWTKQFKPQQRHITLPRKDFDLIRRWPKAAGVLHIDVHESDVMYKGMELTYDGGPRRYQAPAGPVQTDIEAPYGEENSHA